MDAAAKRSILTLSVCMDAARNQGGSYDDKFKVCSAESNAEFKYVGLGMTWKAIWQNFGWHLLWAMPVVFLVLPLTLYGTIRILVKTGGWVARGFAESRS